MIINFGSINIDIVMHVQKLPTPGDTILCPSYQSFPGGKGANQAVAASLAGSEVYMIGQVGNDEFGQLALKSLKSKGVKTDYIAIDSIPTGCASISVDKRGENIITVASGANSVLTASRVPDNLLMPGVTVLLQMEIDPKQSWELVKKARQQQCRTILNLAPACKIPSEVLHNLDYLIVNEIEARHLGKDLKVPTSDLEKLSEFLAKKFNLTTVITLGEKGVIAYTNEGKEWKIPALKVNTVDTTGAGDAFVGILSAMLDQGKDFPTALQYSVTGSGLCCARKGAQPSLPTRLEIESALKDAPEPQITQRKKP